MPDGYVLCTGSVDAVLAKDYAGDYWVESPAQIVRFPVAEIKEICDTFVVHLERRRPGEAAPLWVVTHVKSGYYLTRRSSLVEACDQGARYFERTSKEDWLEALKSAASG